MAIPAGEHEFFGKTVEGDELPAVSTNATIPAEFLEPGTEYKFEVLAREVSGNQTVTHSSFEPE